MGKTSRARRRRRKTSLSPPGEGDVLFSMEMGNLSYESACLAGEASVESQAARERTTFPRPTGTRPEPPSGASPEAPLDIDDNRTEPVMERCGPRPAASRHTGITVSSSSTTIQMMAPAALAWPRGRQSRSPSSRAVSRSSPREPRLPRDGASTDQPQLSTPGQAAHARRPTASRAVSNRTPTSVCFISTADEVYNPDPISGGQGSHRGQATATAYRNRPPRRSTSGSRSSTTWQRD